MSDILTLYPVMTPEREEKLGYVASELELVYDENYEQFPLVLSEKSGNAKNFKAHLSDPKCAWYPETHNLIIRKKCSFGDVDSLFGTQGIVPRGATIGIACSWISTRSEHRKTVPFGELHYGDNNKELVLEYAFDKALIKGSLLLQTILYLKDAGEIIDGEKHLASKSGTILGTLDNGEIFVDGNGSVFPIGVVNCPGKPLWWVYYDSIDPLVDPFDEDHVEIKFNSAHPNYEALKIEGSLKESPLFLEVISAALMIIVESVKESASTEWDNILNGNGFERGSIAEAVYYFISKLQWDPASPVSLASSIHTFFDNHLQGGSL